jgi:hypothetical protein
MLPLDKLGVTHYIVTVSLSNRQGDSSDFLRSRQTSLRKNSYYLYYLLQIDYLIQRFF